MRAAEDHAVTVSTRERILAAARKVFLDGPPESATMDALAQEAGMSKKTIYREFKSQFELLAALGAETVGEMNEITIPGPDSDLELELYGLLTRLVARLLSPRTLALARLIIREVRRYPELMPEEKKKDYPSLIVARWLSAPVVRARYQIDNPEEAAAMLMGMVIQDTAFKLLLSDKAPLPQHLIEQRARRAVAVFLRGVRKDVG
jgi:AcrR family transcriptional regulator